MQTYTEQPLKMMLDVGKLTELNSQGYAGKFCLGDTVVLACGGWKGGPRYIHERDAFLIKQPGLILKRNAMPPEK